MAHLDQILGFGAPLINSASPWATTKEQLRELYLCQYTSAVTVRTSTLSGYAHSDTTHQYTFYDPSDLATDPYLIRKINSVGSLNTLGYSPIPLNDTLKNIAEIIAEARPVRHENSKPFIISITGSPIEVTLCIQMIRTWRSTVFSNSGDMKVYVEINLSCPNISGTPPPAFTSAGIESYLECMASATPDGKSDFVIMGIKLPPYSNPENFAILKSAIMKYVASPQTANSLGINLNFITACNTLGCSMIMNESCVAKLGSVDGMGIGGMAGAPLHPLALGNVALLRKMLDSEPAISHVPIIGIGGVSDAAGFARMQAAGATVVGVGTAFGVEGIDVFEKIVQPRPLEVSHHGRNYVT